MVFFNISYPLDNNFFEIEIGCIELFRETLFSALIFVVELDRLFSAW